MHRWLTRRVAIIAGASVVALVLLSFAALYVAQRDRAMPNTSVAGVDVGRLSSAEVRDAVAPLVAEREDDPIVLAFENETFALEPSEVAYEIDLDATVDAVMARGRSGLPGELGTRLSSLRRSADIDVAHDHDPDALRAWVESVAEQVDRDISPGLVEPDPTTLDVRVVMPHSSAEVRQDETADLLTDALLSDGPRELELPVDTEPQLVPDTSVEAVAAQVEAAIDGELELHANDETLAFSPSELATIIEVVEQPDGDTATLELTVDTDALADVIGDVDEVGDRFATSPVNASYETSRTPPVSFDVPGSTSFEPVEADVEVVPGRDGTSFDLDLLDEQLTELLRDGARSAELALATEEPELSTELAEELRPTHLLSTFTTYHPAGQARVVNIQLLADTVDDQLLLPGDQFSINGISGRRTCAGGYRPAGTIVRGELVDTCGGGTSQFGTTTFNAAFFAGVQLDQWKAHSWYFSRYPMGREATLNYPELDVKFTNTTDGALVVRTSYTAGSITVSIYGQPVAERVSAQHGGAYNHTSPREEIRDDPARCDDERSVIQSGFGGFSVNVERIIESGDANDSQTISTVYVPQDRIVEQGTRDCSPPPDDDDEDDDNGDDDDGDDNDDADD